jgi:hypothetical protein
MRKRSSIQLQENIPGCPIYFPAFEKGEPVSKNDYIKAKVTRTLSSNNLNPDFVVQGVSY